jgi:hypothetical protein
MLAHAGQCVQPLADGAIPMLKDGLEQLAFLPKVAHQRQGNTGFLCNLADRHPVVAALGKQLFCGQQDGKTAIRAPAGGRLGDGVGVSLAMGFRLSCNNQLLDLAKIVRLFKPQKKGASTGAPDPFETGKSGSAGA